MQKQTSPAKQSKRGAARRRPQQSAKTQDHGQLNVKLPKSVSALLRNGETLKLGTRCADLREADLETTRVVAAKVLGMLARGEGATLEDRVIATIDDPNDPKRQLVLRWEATPSEANLYLRGPNGDEWISVGMLEQFVDVLTSEVLPRARAYLANEKRNLAAMLGGAVATSPGETAAPAEPAREGRATA